MNNSNFNEKVRKQTQRGCEEPPAGEGDPHRVEGGRRGLAPGAARVRTFRRQDAARAFDGAVYGTTNGMGEREMMLVCAAPERLGVIIIG